MLCPKCRNNVTGKWCPICGENLEELINTNFLDNDEQESDEINNVQDNYRDDKFSDEPLEGYISPEEAVNPYNDYYGSEPPVENSNNKAKIIAIVSIIISVVIAAGVLLYVFVFSTNDQKNEGGNSSGHETIDPNTEEINSKVKSLTKDGEKHMANGDYEKAEEVYSELSDLTNDEEVNTIYEILYNYNSAVDKLDAGDYDLAQEYYNSIPDEYINYDIKSDVEDLEDEIKAAQKAKKAIDEIEEYIDDEDLESAREAIEEIDADELPPAEQEKLEELIEKLEELEEEEKEKEKSYDYPQSGYGRLRFTDAQIILKTYCSAMVDAINEYDFGLVSPYILSSSDFYDDQEALIESCYDQGIFEYFEYVELNTLTEISKTKWKAQVTEAETVYTLNEDGSYEEEYKTFEWTYTIEYKDHYFYISAIE